ncbi:winged helix-turn-helix domain-containing protein [Radicibacter daui]|uniref:winged helix-turn-helix domain-containing protein n=1 Tax=Radicibacter daui TaxID=3064829 RepID=UPI004046D80C
MASAPKPGHSGPGLRLRVVFGPERFLGPGKANLLEHIATERSLTAAAKAMGLSYRRGWALLNDLNTLFDGPLVETRKGGQGGGGSAELTPLGREVLERYRRMQQAAEAAVAADLAWMQAHTPTDG